MYLVVTLKGSQHLHSGLEKEGRYGRRSRSPQVLHVQILAVLQDHTQGQLLHRASLKHTWQVLLPLQTHHLIQTSLQVGITLCVHT